MAALRSLTPEDMEDTLAELDVCRRERAKCLGVLRRDPDNLKEQDRLAALEDWIARYTRQLEGTA
jgi:hypothetical protein